MNNDTVIIYDLPEIESLAAHLNHISDVMMQMRDALVILRKDQGINSHVVLSPAFAENLIEMLSDYSNLFKQTYKIFLEMENRFNEELKCK